MYGVSACMFLYVTLRDSKLRYQTAASLDLGAVSTKKTVRVEQTGWLLEYKTILISLRLVILTAVFKGSTIFFFFHFPAFHTKLSTSLKAV